MPTQVPARLHVLLARDAPFGVVIRRGPTRMACTIGWNRATDEFQLGQWLRGRLYEECCDLTPDGGHFMYYVNRYRGYMDYEAYTAISRPPFLTAVVWAAGIGRCTNGGIFTCNNRYWIECSDLEERRAPGCLLRRDRGPAPARFASQSARLVSDGWLAAEPLRNAGGALFASVHRRHLGHGWQLVRTGPAGPQLWLDGLRVKASYAIAHPERRTELPMPSWAWADRDGERLVWASAGCLWTGQLDEAGLRDERCLHDFNDMQFEPRVAPYEGVQRE